MAALCCHTLQLPCGRAQPFQWDDLYRQWQHTDVHPIVLTPHQAEVFKCNAFVLVQGAVYMQYMYESNLRYLGVLRVSTPTSERVPGPKLQLAPRKDAGTYCSSARKAETGRQCTRCQRLQATHHVLSPNSLMHQRLHQHVCTHGIGT